MGDSLKGYLVDGDPPGALRAGYHDYLRDGASSSRQLHASGQRRGDQELPTISRSESPVEWSQTANTLAGVAVRSRSQQSLSAVSNVSPNRLLSGIGNQLFDLLALD